MPPATATEVELHALFQRGLGQRHRRQDGMALHAAELLACAGDRPHWQTRAQLLQAWVGVAKGRYDDCESSAGQVLEAFENSGDATGTALCRDLLALCCYLRSDLDGAIALMQVNLAMPLAVRTPLEWSISYSRMAVIHERWGKFDDALRWHYRAIAAARDSGDAACEAGALAGAGGLQLSLQNLDDAATLCERAWQIVQGHRDDWTSGWSTAVINLMMLRHFQGQTEAALALAQTVVVAEPDMPLNNACKRKMLLAMVFAGAGQTGCAQALLDEGLALGRTDLAPLIEWVWTQARLWNQAGRHRDALRLCVDHQHAKVEGRLVEADLPTDLVGLHTEAALASEALGDFAAALHAQRAVTAAERELVSTATRAHRLTLQIQFDLDASKRERDAAVQREREAGREQSRLAELNHALREADLAKSRFLAAASHDLRQPIHALGLQLAHLRSCVVEGEGVAIAQRMERAIGSLNTMFDTLLDISRMDAGVVTPRRQPVALRPFMARLVEEFMPLAQAKGLRLLLRVAGRAHADTDPTLLESLVRNLLSNALKYTERGGVLFALRPAGACWRLEVWDSGPGIAPDEQARVFEEFYQIGGPSRDRAGGMGLGLAIARRLARLLEHPLQLQSRPGHGTRFSVLLERAEGAPPLAAETPPVLAHACLVVAIIEDDAEVRDSLAALLRRWGHDVLAAASATELLRQHGAAPRAIEAVIADYRLRGDATGDAHALQLFAALGNTVPALIVTGDTAPERLSALAGCGMPWLSKPVQPARLRSWLSSVADAQRT